MKHTFRTIIIIYSLLIFNSCKKGINQTPANYIKEEIISKPVTEQFAFVSTNLKSLMLDIAPLFKKWEFIDYLHVEAKKKFDGEAHVLFKTIIDNPQFSKFLNIKKIASDLEVFKGINGENLYPQLYIPNFDAHLTAKSRISSRTTDEQVVEFVIYDGNEEVVNVPTYTYNEEGEIIPTGTIANEQYAIENEIYVISINETVDNDGVPPANTGVDQILGETNFRIENIHVKDTKESWLSGDSEVHIKAVGATWNHRVNGSASSGVIDYPVLRYASSTDLKGFEIKKVKRSDILSGVGSQYTINYPLHIGWKIDNFYSDPIVYSYVIFEYDKWPAGMKTAASLIPSSPSASLDKNFLNFRSSNSPYGGESAGYNSYTSYSIYGNVSGLPALLANLYYDGYSHTSTSLDFTTKKY